MKGKQLIIYAVTVVVIVAAFAIRPERRLGHLPLHSTMEAVEALSVLLMSLVLLGRKEDGGNDKLILPALGFLGMGIMNLVHAASLPGEQFVFLRAAASLAGGLGFALVWLPASYRRNVYKRWSPWAVVAGSVALCLWPYLAPAALPSMVSRGEFSAFAITINLLAGTFFLLGTWRFLADLTRTNDMEDLLFGLVGIFFGLSGLAFQYSMLWTENWWFWHALRLIGSLLVLDLLVRSHLRTVTTLKNSLIELKRAENGLRRSYGITRTIIDSMNDSISLIDVQNFKIVAVNRKFLEEYGYSDESEIAGKHCYEITHHRSDPCLPPDDICPISGTVKTGGHFAAEHVHYGRQGEKIYVEVSTSPIKDEDGNVLQVVHSSRDITERRQAQEERERLLSDLERSNKDLEQFAYVASHDLQEPLRTVTAYVQLLQKKFQGQMDAKADRYIYFIVDGADRMRNLIDALLAYSRITRRGEALKTVDMNAAFSAAVSNLSASIREVNATVAKDDLPEVLGDETQLAQLLQNLIGNGMKYRKADVPPRIEVFSRREDNEYVFSVRDNGIGIESKYYEQVFQIFQRLHSHAEYPGTGIGLAICKRIVERHHGRIWVESVPGRGSTFFFTMPAPVQEKRDALPEKGSEPLKEKGRV
jgi:PAS domain S-box-containing protein